MKKLASSIWLVGLLGFGSVELWNARGAETAPDAVTFVCQLYKHGVPYTEARSYTGQDVAPLLQVLADPARKAYWPNTVITLGIIGDDRVTQPLIDFIERRFTGEVDLNEFNALLSVPLALGHAALHGNRTALDYLLATHTPAGWKAKGLAWTFQRYQGDVRDLLLAKMTIRGLAFACHPEARALLLKLRDSTEAPYVQLREKARANITEALEFDALLERDGPEKTFVFTEPPPAKPKPPASSGNSAPPAPDEGRK